MHHDNGVGRPALARRLESCADRARTRLGGGDPIPVRFDRHRLDRTGGPANVPPVEPDHAAGEFGGTGSTGLGQCGISAVVQPPEAGTLFVFSYNGQGFSTPIGRGVEGLLFSPGRGLFIFNPVAVLGVLGIGILVWRNRPLGVMFILLIVARTLFFAKWASWDGGVDWGPRLMFPVVFCLVIGAVEVLQATQARGPLGILARATFTVLAVVSLGISFLSVRVPYEQWWVTISSPTLRTPFARDGLLVPHPSAVDAAEDAWNFTERGSQIQGNLDLLEKGDAHMAPASFRTSDPIGGWILLTAGVGLLAAAGVMGRGLRRANDPYVSSG